MTFKWNYRDNLDHIATFETRERAIQHFIMRNGLAEEYAPTFAAIYDENDFFEVTPSYSDKFDCIVTWATSMRDLNRILETT